MLSENHYFTLSQYCTVKIQGYLDKFIPSKIKNQNF